ncbi:MAG: nucleic acid-binding protein [Anaerolineaceae bacterium 4572_78]|nr:MAG: nucleic acid-binding protein [Anaerolineaceae bacterium 4572_78]
MSLYILDTDHVTFLEHKHPKVIKHAVDIGNDSLAITIITVEEQIRGRFSTIRRLTKTAKIVRAYHDLLDTLSFLCKFQVIPFDQAAYEQFSMLRQQKIRIGTMDLRIGAIALAHQAIVVTRNQRDFGQIPNVRLKDWTA